MSLIADASQKITERLTWCTALKDQPGIAKDLAAGKEIEEVYGLGEAGLFDEFFCFLSHFGIKDLLIKLEPKLKQRESSVTFSAVILIYLMRIVAGCPFFWNIKSVLLQSQSLMRLVGFNAQEIREGTCERGIHKSRLWAENKENPDDKGFAKIRGPICSQFVATSILAITASALERFFNRTISILAAHCFFPKRIHAVMDASEIQSTERGEGCGKVSKEKAPELRRRKKRIRKVLETIFGFKIWVVWDPLSKLPIAMRFTTIEVADIQMARQLVQQAVVNLGEHAKIVSLAFDRGFIDGSFMWWLHKDKGIIFYVPAKTNMNVYEDALCLADSGIRETRQLQRTVGKGKNSTTVTDQWDVVGIQDLTSAGFYGEKGSGSHENRNDFIANPINAVVVLHDPYKENNPDSDTMVILTNGPVNKPLDTYDGYDARSEIENSLFREAKQAWFIQRPAQNTKDAFCAHAYLTIITMALTTAFRTWMDRQDKLDQQGKETGIRKFREKVRQENGNKFIVFDKDRYAIFEAYELVILCGRNVRQPKGKPETITKKDILIKYGALLE
jgi:hypothetical protein